MDVDTQELYRSSELGEELLKDPEVGHIAVNLNKIISMKKIAGLEVDVQETEDGVNLSINVKEKTIIYKPVHLCFGVLSETGVQKIILQVNVGKDAKITILAHCVFPNATYVKHIMDADIKIGAGAEYTYLERHIHGIYGGVEVYPEARIFLEEGARFKTDFELLRGRVGKIEIDYETVCGKRSVMEMTAKIKGAGDDIIGIKEVGYLVGEGARGVLTTRVAVSENARANVYNKLVAEAPYTRGHVDCKEIVQGNAKASATPVVEVNHPRAHITHEAAIGSVDTKQLETLMARGLGEDKAVELIIDGLLS
ncbi:SufD family Fe-S cluster assembly protein [Candidatus Aerophobetes bacterium]|nr:SufD family Fe-S cluster assembly protein [Candidatus Aerophobetes bacterium]